jgi:hypothetical protein
MRLTWSGAAPATSGHTGASGSPSRRGKPYIQGVAGNKNGEFEVEAQFLSKLHINALRTLRALSGGPALRSDVCVYGFGFLFIPHFYPVPHFGVARRSLRRSAKIVLGQSAASLNPYQ